MEIKKGGILNEHSPTPAFPIEVDVNERLKDVIKNKNAFDSLTVNKIQAVQYQNKKKALENLLVSKGPDSSPTVIPKPQHIGQVKWFTWLLYDENIVRSHVAACLMQNGDTISNGRERMTQEGVLEYELNEDSKMIASAITPTDNLYMRRKSPRSGQPIKYDVKDGADANTYNFYNQLWKLQTKGKTPITKGDSDKEALIQNFSATETRREYPQSPFNKIKEYTPVKETVVEDSVEKDEVPTSRVVSKEQPKEPYLNAREYIADVWKKNREEYSYLGDDNPFLQDPPDPAYLLKNFGRKENLNSNSSKEPKTKLYDPTKSGCSNSSINSSYTQQNQRGVYNQTKRVPKTYNTDKTSSSHVPHMPRSQYSSSLLKARARLLKIGNDYSDPVTYDIKEEGPSEQARKQYFTKPTPHGYSSRSVNYSQNVEEPYSERFNYKATQVDDSMLTRRSNVSTVNDYFSTEQDNGQPISNQPVDRYRYFSTGRDYYKVDSSNYGTYNREQGQPQGYKGMEDNYYSLGNQRNEDANGYATKYPNSDYYFGKPKPLAEYGYHGQEINDVNPFKNHKSANMSQEGNFKVKIGTHDVPLRGGQIQDPDGYYSPYQTVESQDATSSIGSYNNQISPRVNLNGNKSYFSSQQYGRPKQELNFRAEEMNFNNKSLSKQGNSTFEARRLSEHDYLPRNRAFGVQDQKSFHFTDDNVLRNPLSKVYRGADFMRQTQERLESDILPARF